MKRRKILLGCCIVIALIGGLFAFFNRNVELLGLEKLNEISVQRVLISKTFEDGENDKVIAERELSKMEIKEFLVLLNEGTFKSQRSDTFRIESENRYYVDIYGDSDEPICTMKIYNEEVLLFCYADGESPLVDGKYVMKSRDWFTFVDSLLY